MKYNIPVYLHGIGTVYIMYMYMYVHVHVYVHYMYMYCTVHYMQCIIDGTR